MDRAVVGGVDDSAAGRRGEFLHGVGVVADGVEFRWISAGQGDAVQELGIVMNGGERRSGRGGEGKLIAAGGGLGDGIGFWRWTWSVLEKGESKGLVVEIFLAVGGVDTDVEGGALGPGDLKTRVARGLCNQLSERFDFGSVGGEGKGGDGAGAEMPLGGERKFGQRRGVFFEPGA